MEISRERLEEDIRTNGTFGEVEADGHGRTVLTGSDADREARNYFVERLEERGLDVRVDAVGNVAGRWVPDGADPDAAPVAAGSHLDSVPHGGIFDGPLGVYAALEAVRTIQDADRTPERPIEVVSFTEEEGASFGTGLLGSSVAAGQRSIEAALEREDGTGTTLEQRLERIGFRGEGRLDPGGWDAWFEVHIEQSSRLEEAGLSVGIVPAITGITNCAVTIDGESDHAGATPQNRRADALVAASAFVGDIERTASELVATDAPFAVATVGEFEVEPNVRNIIPERVELTLDARDVESETMDELVDRARKILARIEAEGDVTTDLDRYRTTEPAHMSERCTGALRDAADRRGLETIDIPSGGGHDTMSAARLTDTGMLFAPSVDGVSHSPREWTDFEDCARITGVLAGAIAELSGAAE